MRVLHILDHSLPLHSGYTFRTRAILAAQTAAGVTVAGMTGVRQAQHGEPAVDRPQADLVDGFTFYRTPATRSWPSPIREWAEVDVLARNIHHVVPTFRPTLLHAHSPLMNAMATERAARRHGLPWIYEIRAFWEDAAVSAGSIREGGPRYRAIRAMETRMARRADAVAVICEGLKRDLIDRGIDAGKIMISPNGVDLALFGTPPARDAALAAQLGLEGGEVVGFIGSFYDYEGLDDLIAAMPALLERRPRAHLLLVGGGPMEKSLAAQAAASPAAARIHFVGRVPHQEVERYYSLIDVLAYPRKAMRLTELVTPLKPLEAMAQQRLVAASDVGGHRELITDGETGILFPAGQPAGLAKAVANLLATPDRWPAMRAAGRQFVEEQRNWSSNISRYEPVYRKLLKAAARD